MLEFLYTKTPLSYFIQSLWRDEAFSYLLAKHSIVDIIKITSRDFNPPLYYFILKIWMLIFGNSELAIRSLSFLCYGFLFYFFIELLIDVLKIKGKKLSLYALLFFVNPLLNYYAFEGRMYMLFALISTASYYFLMTKRSRLYFISLLLGLYTHYFMTIVLATQVLFVLMSGWTKKEKIHSIKHATYSFLLFIPWIVYFLFQNKSIDSNFWILKPGLRELLSIPFTLYTGYEYFLYFYQKFSLGFILFMWILIGSSLVLMRDKLLKNDVVKSLFFWFTIPSFSVFIISLWKPLFLPRYLIFTGVGLIIYLIYVFEYSKYKILSIVMLITLFMFSLHFNVIQIKERRKADFKTLAAKIKPHLNSQTIIYVENELDFHTAQYYFYQVLYLLS